MLEVVGEFTESLDRVRRRGKDFQRVGLVAIQAGNGCVVVDEVLSLKVIKQESQRDRRGHEIRGVYYGKVFIAPEDATNVAFSTDNDARTFYKALIMVADDAT